MADVKISGLTAVAAATAADVFAVVQGGTTLKETLAQAQATISATNIAATTSLTALSISATQLQVTTANISATFTAGTVVATNGVTSTTFTNSGGVTLSIANGVVIAII